MKGISRLCIKEIRIRYFRNNLYIISTRVFICQITQCVFLFVCVSTHPWSNFPLFLLQFCYINFIYNWLYFAFDQCLKIRNHHFRTTTVRGCKYYSTTANVTVVLVCHDVIIVRIRQIMPHIYIYYQSHWHFHFVSKLKAVNNE